MPGIPFGTAGCVSLKWPRCDGEVGVPQDDPQLTQSGTTTAKATTPSCATSPCSPLPASSPSGVQSLKEHSDGWSSIS